MALYRELDRRYGFCWDLAANAANTKSGRYYFGPGSDFGEDALVIDWQETIVRAQALQFYASLERPGVDYCRPKIPIAFLNPPFSRQSGGLDAWIEKCEVEVARGLAIIGLLSADTSTRYFRRIQRAGWPIALTKRLSYENQASGKLEPAKFGSMIVEMWPEIHGVTGR